MEELQKENEDLKLEIENLKKKYNSSFDGETVNLILIYFGALFIVWLTYYLCQLDIANHSV